MILKTFRNSTIACAVALAFAAGPAGAGTLDVGLDIGVGGGGGGVGVGLDVGLGGGGVDAGLDVGVGGSGGTGVGVDISLGGGGTGGTGGTGTGPGAGPGTPGKPGVPGVVPGTVVAASTKGGGLTCARDANETAYNGFVVRDRHGDTIGWVHGVTVSPDGKLLAVRLQAVSSACYKLSGVGVRIAANEIWANVDSSAFR